MCQWYAPLRCFLWTYKQQETHTHRHKYCATTTHNTITPTPHTHSNTYTHTFCQSFRSVWARRGEYFGIVIQVTSSWPIIRLLKESEDLMKREKRQSGYTASIHPHQVTHSEYTLLTLTLSTESCHETHSEYWLLKNHLKSCLFLADPLCMQTVIRIHTAVIYMMGIIMAERIQAFTLPCSGWLIIPLDWPAWIWGQYIHFLYSRAVFEPNEVQGFTITIIRSCITDT